MALWRYVAHLFGVSGPLLFRDYEHGLHLYRVARACELDPDLEAIAIANSLINSAPLIIGVETEAERRRMAVELYRLSRAAHRRRAGRPAEVSETEHVRMSGLDALQTAASRCRRRRGPR